MRSDFAYSGTMQLLLAVITYINSFIHMYCNVSLTLQIYDERATRLRRAIFAILTGPVLHITFTYLMYFIGGRSNFTATQYAFITGINPIMTMLYLLLGIVILQLPKGRSIELMGNSFMYSSVIHCMNTLLGASLLTQDDPLRYNYMYDAIRVIISVFISLGLYRVFAGAIRRNPGVIIRKEAVMPRPVKDLALYILKACLVYGLMVGVPLLIENYLVEYILLFTILTLMLVLSLMRSFLRYSRALIENKQAHIHSLISTADEFREVKHDFYNILQTYSGYLELGDLEACKKYHNSLTGMTVSAGESLDLGLRLEENPALISLILEKRTQAAQQEVPLSVSIMCTVDDLPLENVALCRIVAALLDSAIEAASGADRRQVMFTMERKRDGSRLIIVANSVGDERGDDSEEDGAWSGGLRHVRRIVERYSNCTYQTNYYNNETIAYIELRE